MWSIISTFSANAYLILSECCVVFFIRMYHSNQCRIEWISHRKNTCVRILRTHLRNTHYSGHWFCYFVFRIGVTHQIALNNFFQLVSSTESSINAICIFWHNQDIILCSSFNGIFNLRSWSFRRSIQRGLSSGRQWKMQTSIANRIIFCNIIGLDILDK